METRVRSSSSRRWAGGLGLGALARELLAEPVEQADRVGTEAVLEVGQGGPDRAGPAFRLVAGDEQVADLVEQAERPDLAGLDRRRARFAQDVHPRGETADPGRVGDDQVAARPDQRLVDRVPLARLAPDVERHEVAGLAHRRSMARPPDGPPASGGRRSGRDGLARAGGRDVLDRAAQELETGRVEVVGPRPDPVGLRERRVEPGRERLARHQDDVGGPVDELAGRRCRR